MTDTQPLPILATHSGKFHCNELFAYAVLRLALGLHTPGQDHILRRTRKPDLIESADIVWNVGSIFDAPARRSDHHQRGAPVRDDGTPFSSAGLVWQVYGQRAVAALLRQSHSDSFAKPIADELENGIVKRIDEIDNGVAAGGPFQRDTLGLATLISEYNPSRDAPDANGPTAGDAAFLEAASLAEGVLRRPSMACVRAYRPKALSSLPTALATTPASWC